MKAHDVLRAQEPEEEDPHQKAKNRTVLSKADEAKIEAHDEVKAMNSMVNKAKCYKVLDKQKDEKLRIILEEQKEEERLALEMEIERLKFLRKKELEQQDRIVKAHEQKKVIVDQIKERQKIRLKHQESKQKEQEQMLRHAQALVDEENAAAEAKHKQALRMVGEMNEANEQNLFNKVDKKNREKQEDDKVVL